MLYCSHDNRFNNMLREIIEETDWATADAFDRMAKCDYLSFVQFIAKAEIVASLKLKKGSRCILDYPVDRYLDKTREDFYLRYLNRNYTKEGFFYEGLNGIDDLSIEMMIYTHLWESSYFMKTLARMSSILLGRGYEWKPKYGKWDYMQKDIIIPLKKMNIHFGSVLEKAYSSEIRNAFAHSLYTVDIESKSITMRTKHMGIHTISFYDFQKRFLYSVLLMNSMLNALDRNRIKACRKNTAITGPFLTPDGVSVQIIAETIMIEGKATPRFRMNRLCE